MEAIQSLQRFDLEKIKAKQANWIVHEKTLSNVRTLINEYNIGKADKDQIRLNAYNTVISIYNSFINAYNAGNCDFIVLEDGELYIETSKWLLNHLDIATCRSERTAANHLKKIHKATQNGFTAFLPNWIKPTSNHRFDSNIRIKINPQLLVFTTRRKRFEPFKVS
ncbi:hypothetical protein ACE193_23615 [Bernardetia sp. OM2101]|uniref:hypothetical protein n=1 Tax=Bernardetia sp. OM2101 TaxID=3344876 RepID=UPI0035CEEF93